MKITMFKNVYEKTKPFHTYLTVAISRIREGKSIETISKVRAGNKEEKLKLPVILFSGEFSSRNDDALFEHSGYIVLDFDHVNVDEVKLALATDRYIYACWISPSGDGVKALVRITNPERHRDHFRALIKYFQKQYGLELDESGINESRACFESYDPEIIVKEDSEKFGAFTSEKAEAQEVEMSEEGYTDYMKLNLAARMVRIAEDGDKHNSLIKASRLCGGYIAAGRMEEEEVIRVLFREICKRDISSETDAMKTISDGIREGKDMPIKELLDSEKTVKRDLLINDGDMSFISSDDEDFRWIDDFSQGKVPLGLDTGDVELDKYFRYKKEFLITNGHSNVGKTTAMLYLLINSAVRHGWKWVIYSSENRTASIKMQIMQFAMDKKVGNMSYSERKRAYKWTQDHFTIINNKQVYSYSDILVFMEKIMLQQDVDGVFIDPYNSLKLDMKGSGLGTHDYHYEAMSEFLTFSKANDVALWVNMHSVTEAQRRKGPDGLPVAPYAEDSEGGGKSVNRCDGFLTIHRKVQSPDPGVRAMTEVHIRKIREVETGGSPTALDTPYLMTMNVAHTAFVGWLSQKPLFKPIPPTIEEQANMSF